MMVFPQNINIFITFQDRVFLLSGTHRGRLEQAFTAKGYEVISVPYDRQESIFTLEHELDSLSLNDYVLVDILDDDVFPSAGDLPNTTKAQQKGVFNFHKTMFGMLKEKNSIIITPLSRPSQPIGNLDEWRVNFKSFSYSSKRKRRTKLRFINPAPLLKAHHWGDDDPVHPLQEGYNSIVDFLEQAWIKFTIYAPKIVCYLL
jgi:hypothetical protein